MQQTVLDKGFVRLVDHMGSDLTVVNAARVSFAKESQWECLAHDDRAADDYDGKQCYNCYLSDKDAKLIRYLAKHEHWTPFGHPQVTLHFRWPIFVARQAMRSNIGICWNEVSRRYVDDPPEFYEPEVWRRPPKESIKQGSGETIDLRSVETAWMDGGEPYRWLQDDVDEALEASNKAYNNLIQSLCAAPEMARMVLPQSMYTECWGTFSLAALARFYKLRSDSHAQLEIQRYAEAISNLVQPLYPVSWEALNASAE